MEQTFNLKRFIEKRANMDSEGSQGYFLAQSRAWMNCSKCKRNEGKTAQQAWQECFEEFQAGDRKLSWLEHYAKDSANVISKEAAIDYSAEIIHLAADGVPMQDAVMGAIKTAQAKWWERLRDATPFGKGQRAVRDIDRATVNDISNRTTGMPDIKIDAQTYNQLLYIQRLITNNEYDSGSIKRLVRGIPNEEVKNSLEKYVTYIEGTERSFAQRIDEMSAVATKMIEKYHQKQTFDLTSAPEAAPETTEPMPPPRDTPEGRRSKDLSRPPPSVPPAAPAAAPAKRNPAKSKAPASRKPVIPRNKTTTKKTVPRKKSEVEQGFRVVSVDHGKTWKATSG